MFSSEQKTNFLYKFKIYNMKKFTEFNLTVIKGKAFNFFKGVSSIIIIGMAIISGYWGRGVIESQKKSAITIMHPTNSIDNTSVAVNERDELIIFDRKSGDYKIYAKEVRMAIFNQQFSKIQTIFNSKK
jgi:hypothetical protein